VENIEVLVVGAGPTGLLLAGDLAEAGVSVTVLERRAAEKSNLTRAFAVHARTLEELDARGVADELIATGRRLDNLRLFGSTQVELSGLPSRFPFVLITPQFRTEEVLLRRALAAGACVERGVELVELRQDDDAVHVTVRGADGALSARRASYLVGTDGVHSTVRARLGEPFPGTSVVRSMMLADVRLVEAPPSVLTVDTSDDGFVFIAPYGDDWYRVLAWDRYDQQPDSAPVSLEQVRELVRRVLGTDYGMVESSWTSRFHSDERQAPRYRVGRVFLAGDAAHVHSPAGGQGMNTGLQDAANLSWRLVGVLRGWAPPAVLDGYQAERHPVGRMVLRGSHALLRGALMRGRARRAVRSALVGAVLRVGVLGRRVGAVLSGVGVRYPAPRGAHRAVGSRVPDLALTGDGPSRLYEALRGGRWVVVASTGAGASHAGQPDAEALAARHGWRGPVTVVHASVPPKAELLVRPDGYLAATG
jgi:2-polyprenyl-6-methoxyphenol hydroxylase-like FAD-dependent oxidoreductase